MFPLCKAAVSRCIFKCGIYSTFSGYSAQAIYHTGISVNLLQNHLQSDDYTTDKPLIYAVLVETYFTLGRALMAEKKLVLFYRNINNKN